MGGSIIVQKDAFLCAAMGTKVTMRFNRKLGTGLFGGEGFILQELQGDGKAFIHAGGTVIERTLNRETLRVDTGCVVGFEPSIDFDIEQAGNLRSMVFGGEGMFLAHSAGGEGVATVDTIRKLIAQLGTFGGNSRKESGGLLNNLFE